MYKDLIQKIKDTLEGVQAIKKVYPYALREGEKITNYPAVVFFPDSAENSFETESQNRKNYRFLIYVVCSTEGIGNEAVGTDILPNAVDQVIEEFDKEWSLGVTGSNRTWQVLETASAWTLPYTESGLEMAAPLVLRISLLTNN